MFRFGALRMGAKQPVGSALSCVVARCRGRGCDGMTDLLEVDFFPRFAGSVGLRILENLANYGDFYFVIF
jgi:hypothetical protein